MHPRSILVVVAVVVALACTKQSEPKPTPTSEGSASPAASPVAKDAAAAPTFDGLAIGGTFDRTRAPYDRPCDSDPLEGEPTIKAMFYTGKECRGRQFPDGTSVIVLVEATTSKISALAWVGGTYFDTRDAPLKTGTPIAEAVKLWGEPAVKFDLHTMHVARFTNDARVLSDRHDQVIGFAFGEWPDANGERWDPLEQVYRRYTAPIANAAVSAADCEAAVANAYKQMGTKGPVAQLDIDDCRANTSAATVQCLIAAKTKDAVGKCYNAK